MASENIFREATLRLCGSLDFPKAMKSCFDYLQTVLPLHGIYVTKLEQDDQVVRCFAMHSLNQGSRRNVTISLDEPAMAYIEKIRRNGALISASRTYDPENTGPMYNLQAPILGYEGCWIMMQSLALEEDYRATLLVAALPGEVFTAAQRELVRRLNRPFSIAVSNALAYEEMTELKDRLTADNRELEQELDQHFKQPVIGEFSGLRHIMQMVRQVAPLPSTVLLLGETGVGKEVIAQSIHRQSQCADGPFIKVNCGAIAESLIDSELFGHEKGAFTGAIAAKKGRFERAHRGTIFLDEIGELPPSAQVRLLRVLQERQLQRVGGDRTIDVDIRVIAATHCNLDAMVAEGLFREDLWFRLNAFPLRIPPLRHRKEDIPLFIEYFLEQKGRQLGLPTVAGIEPEILEKLCNYHWPGNVRELENALERALIQSAGGVLSFDGFNPGKVTVSAPPAEDLPYSRCVFPCLAASARCSSTSQPSVLLPLEQMVSQHVRQALEQCGNQIHGEGGAAQLLGINPNTLRSKMAKFGIPFKSASKETA